MLAFAQKQKKPKQKNLQNCHSHCMQICSAAKCSNSNSNQKQQALCNCKQKMQKAFAKKRHIAKSSKTCKTNLHANCVCKKILHNICKKSFANRTKNNLAKAQKNKRKATSSTQNQSHAIAHFMAKQKNTRKKKQKIVKNNFAIKNTLAKKNKKHKKQLPNAQQQNLCNLQTTSIAANTTNTLQTANSAAKQANLQKTATNCQKFAKFARINLLQSQIANPKQQTICKQNICKQHCKRVCKKHAFAIQTKNKQKPICNCRQKTNKPKKKKPFAQFAIGHAGKKQAPLHALQSKLSCMHTQKKKKQQQMQRTHKTCIAQLQIAIAFLQKNCIAIAQEIAQSIACKNWQEQFAKTICMQNKIATKDKTRKHNMQTIKQKSCQNQHCKKIAKMAHQQITLQKLQICTLQHLHTMHKDKLQEIGQQKHFNTRIATKQMPIAQKKTLHKVANALHGQCKAAKIICIAGKTKNKFQNGKKKLPQLKKTFCHNNKTQIAKKLPTKGAKKFCQQAAQKKALQKQKTNCARQKKNFQPMQQIAESKTTRQFATFAKKCPMADCNCKVCNCKKKAQALQHFQHCNSFAKQLQSKNWQKRTRKKKIAKALAIAAKKHATMQKKKLCKALANRTCTKSFAFQQNTNNCISCKKCNCKKNCAICILQKIHKMQTKEFANKKAKFAKQQHLQFAKKQTIANKARKQKKICIRDRQPKCKRTNHKLCNNTCKQNCMHAIKFQKKVIANSQHSKQHCKPATQKKLHQRKCTKQKGRKKIAIALAPQMQANAKKLN